VAVVMMMPVTAIVAVVIVLTATEVT